MEMFPPGHVGHWHDPGSCCKASCLASRHSPLASCRCQPTLPARLPLTSASCHAIRAGWLMLGAAPVLPGSALTLLARNPSAGALTRPSAHLCKLPAIRLQPAPAVVSLHDKRRTVAGDCWPLRRTQHYWSRGDTGPGLIALRLREEILTCFLCGMGT